MSRSRKRIPVIKDHNKGMRELANRTLRRAVKRAIQKDADVMPEANELINPYDISDYTIWPWSEESEIKNKRK